MTTRRVKFHGHVLGYGPGDVADVDDKDGRVQGLIDGLYAEETTDQPQLARAASRHPADEAVGQPTGADAVVDAIARFDADEAKATTDKPKTG